MAAGKRCEHSRNEVSCAAFQPAVIAIGLTSIISGNVAGLMNVRARTKLSDDRNHAT